MLFGKGRQHRKTFSLIIQIADYLVDPLCRGVYASSPRSLSLKSTFPDFHQSELKSGSLIRGMLTNKSRKWMWGIGLT